jgi:hypothetical protein
VKLIWILCLGVVLIGGCGKNKTTDNVLPNVDIDAQAKIEAQIQKETAALSVLPPEPDKRGTESEATPQEPK